MPPDQRGASGLASRDGPTLGCFQDYTRPEVRIVWQGARSRASSLVIDSAQDVRISFADACRLRMDRDTASFERTILGRAINADHRYAQRTFLEGTFKTGSPNLSCFLEIS